MTFSEKILEAAQEGIVLLKNTDSILPLNPKQTVSIFGRGQFEFLKCGMGSGGSVHAPYSTNLTDFMPNADPGLSAVYKEWLSKNPYDNGGGAWAAEPFCQKEMEITLSLADEAARRSKTAVVVIMRNAGEDKDLKAEKGSYFLTDAERTNITNICAAFENVVIVFNTCGIIDTAWTEDAQFGGKIKSILYAWQGGQETGRACANILLGKAVPCAKLSDTIARSIRDYPSTKDFENDFESYYTEDIFTGYRYFNTFANEKILYPFGFGLSYTEFKVEFSKAEFTGTKAQVKASVTNTGKYSGKETVQLYLNAPQGRLGKPLRSLAAFRKTSLLKPGQKETLELSFDLRALSSYDDCGATENRFCRVLEAGEYFLYGGTDVSSAEKIEGSLILESDLVTERLSSALAPTAHFKRLKPGALLSSGNCREEWEEVPRREYDLEKRIRERMPQDVPFTGNKGIKFNDVCKNPALLDAFTAQLTDQELSTLARGEGMSSRKVTAGVASAFGGVSHALYEYGIPVAACADGPSGVRLDTGKEASLMPTGTQLACTWNLPLVEELMQFEGQEICGYQADTILGPGINLHRNPLGGRNFEYFSEDPLLTGAMTVAITKGIASGGAHATIKHFMANNRELNRRQNNSIMSERAAREIYLVPFEMAVKEGGVQAIMTSYNLVNGIQCSSNYDLNVSVLRNEWNYRGLVMTDWWAVMNDCAKGGPSGVQQVSSMIKARGNVYMITENDRAELDGNDDDIRASLKNGTLTRAELALCAKDTIRFLTKSPVAKRPLRSLDDILTFKPRIPSPVCEKCAVTEDVKLMKDGETKRCIEVQEDGIYNFLALYSKPNDETVSQSVCNIRIDGQDALSLDCRTTDGKTIGSTVGIVKLFKGIYEITLEHTKPGIKIEFIGFSRHISSGSGMKMFRNEGEPPEMSIPHFLRDREKKND